MSTILIVILVLLLVGALPSWGWHGGGYGPSGIVGLLLVVLLVLVILGYV